MTTSVEGSIGIPVRVEEPLTDHLALEGRRTKGFRRCVLQFPVDYARLASSTRPEVLLPTVLQLLYPAPAWHIVDNAQLGSLCEVETLCVCPLVFRYLSSAIPS